MMRKGTMFACVVLGTQMHATNAYAEDVPAECSAQDIQSVFSREENDEGFIPDNVIDGDLSRESRWSSIGNSQEIVLGYGQ